MAFAIIAILFKLNILSLLLFLLPFFLLLGVFTPRSAQNAKVRLNNGVVLTAKSWNVVTKADKLDTTNMESAGYAENIPGIQDLEFTIEFALDAAANPYDSPRLLIVTQLQSNIKLYLNDTSGPYWDLDGYIYENNCKADVRGLLEGTVRGSATGVYVEPTGTF